MVVDNLIREEARQRAQQQQQQQASRRGGGNDENEYSPFGSGAASQQYGQQFPEYPPIDRNNSNFHIPGNSATSSHSFHNSNGSNTPGPPPNFQQARPGIFPPNTSACSSVNNNNNIMNSLSSPNVARSSFSQEAPHPPQPRYASTIPRQQQYPCHQLPHYPVFVSQQQQQQPGGQPSSDESQHRSKNAALPSSSSDPQEAVALARNEWRQHGMGMTQALEEMRSTVTTGSYLQQRQQCLPSGIEVRVVAAQTRLDLAQKEYTSYVIRVIATSGGHDRDAVPNNKEWFVEHRYSEFHKLYTLLQRQEVQVNVPFPGRSLAGRLGLWSPAQVWAPQSYHSLIRYRLKQLDVWLVHIVHWVFSVSQQQQQQQNAETTRLVQSAVYQFITEQSPLPCHVDWQATAADSSAINHPPESSLERSVMREAKLNSQSITSLSWWKTYNPLSFSLTSAIRQACWTVQTMCPPPLTPTSKSSAHTNNNSKKKNNASPSLQDSDQSIPVDLLRAAQGLLFLTVVKAGLVVSGRLGTGLLIKRLEQNSDDKNKTSASWSAPIAVGTMGMGWGALAGGDVTHYMVIFTTEKAVLDLVHHKNSLQVGAELDVAVGPVGRGAHSQLHTGDWTLHSAYAYAHSHGFFAGLSLEGSFLKVRNEVNTQFYGSSTLDLLAQPGPPAAQPLYHALERAMERPVHEFAFRPTRVFLPHVGPSVSDTVQTTYYNDDALVMDDDNYVVIGETPADHSGVQTPSLLTNSVLSRGKDHSPPSVFNTAGRENGPPPVVHLYPERDQNHLLTDGTGEESFFNNYTSHSNHGFSSNPTQPPPPSARMEEEEDDSDGISNILF